MDRRDFLKQTGACAAAMAAPGMVPKAFAADGKPLNFLFILIDDMGWADSNCYGNEVYHTPNINKLAASGMRFTDAYAAAPVCSPTRASILTGKYPAHLHMTAHIPAVMYHRYPENAKWLPAESIWQLPLEETTVAEPLDDAGYATGYFGKWHVAGPQKAVGDPDKGVGRPEYYPEHQGFDLNVGGNALGAPPSYFDPYGISAMENRKEGEYLPDRLSDEAVDFVTKNKDNPFLVYLSHYTVHTPMQAKPELEAKYKEKNDPRIKDTAYAAKIEAMDAAVGRVIDSLDENGIADRTVVLFFSDNGGLWRVTDNAPLRAGKGHLYEGGIREPFIVRWPGVTEPGSACSEPVSSIDMLPTILDIAGKNEEVPENIDGRSLVPLLKQEGDFERDAIYWHYPQYSPQGSRISGAIREGDYKLIEFLDDNSIEMYNLAEDIGEKHNLVEKEPERAADLLKKLHEWRKSVDADMPKPNPDFDPDKQPQPNSFEPPWLKG